MSLTAVLIVAVIVALVCYLVSQYYPVTGRPVAAVLALGLVLWLLWLWSRTGFAGLPGRPHS